MIIIDRLNRYLEDRALIKSVRRLVKLTSSNQEIREITVQKTMFIMPGRYSLVYYDRLGQTKINRFIVKEPQDITIKDLFSLK